MLPWKLRQCQILPVNQNFSSVYFSLAKFQLLSCNLSLSMIWQMRYTHKLPKMWSSTLSSLLIDLQNSTKCHFNRPGRRGRRSVKGFLALLCYILTFLDYFSSWEFRVDSSYFVHVNINIFIWHILRLGRLCLHVIRSCS